MSRLHLLKQKVSALYEEKRPGRADWADWLYENHVFQVADKAAELSAVYGGKSELAEAGAVLHDVADAVMSRFDPQHEEMSLEMANDLLTEVGFEVSEVEQIVNDVIKNHGCHGDQMPQTIEGRVMAAADACVHLDTDFYDFGAEMIRKNGTDEDVKNWILPKIERDLYKKIQFDDLREEYRKYYDDLKQGYS